MEQIKIMLDMQAVLDSHITSNNGQVKLTREMVNTALIDEIGEMNHELKGSWCWWKKTQAPVNREKVLEELVDVWHFALSYENHFGIGCDILNVSDEDKIEETTKGIEYSEIISKLIETKLNKLFWCFALTKKLGYTLDEVFEGYLEKNKKNHNRQARGY